MDGNLVSNLLLKIYNYEATKNSLVLLPILVFVIIENCKRSDSIDRNIS